MLTPPADKRYIQASTKPWYLLGAGAMGCLYASQYIDSGNVRLLLPSSRLNSLLEHKQCIQVEQLNGELTAIPSAMLSPWGEQQSIDQLIICTKAQHTCDAISHIEHRLSDDCRIVLLQNGLGLCHELVEKYPNTQCTQALSTHGAWRQNPQHIVHAGAGHTLFDGGLSAEFLDAIQTLQTPQFSWTAVDDMPQRLWQKLAINCAINPFTAIYGCKNGELRQHGIEQQQLEVCDEVYQVAKALGVTDLDAPAALLKTVQNIMASTAENRSSMLQDVMASRGTEITHLNGYIVQQAAKLGIPCPRNTELVQAISQRDAMH